MSLAQPVYFLTFFVSILKMEQQTQRNRIIFPKPQNWELVHNYTTCSAWDVFAGQAHSWMSWMQDGPALRRSQFLAQTLTTAQITHTTCTEMTCRHSFLPGTHPAPRREPCPVTPSTPVPSPAPGKNSDVSSLLGFIPGSVFCCAQHSWLIPQSGLY